MRTNYEDELRTSGRLSKVARTMGWCERKALGSCVLFWRHTQDAEIVEATRGQIVTLTVVDHDSDEEAERFFDAMVKARLVSKIDGDLYRIHGNAEHVERLKRMRANASKGGKARQKKLNNGVADGLADAKPELSDSEASAKQIGALLAPGSRLPAVGSNEPTEDRARDEQRSKEIRSTRGFPENAFAAEHRDRGKAAGVTVAAPDDLELSIIGKLIKRCGSEGVTQAQLLTEWWRPEWREFHGFDIKALDRHFAKVRATIADPGLRPKARETVAEPKRARPPTAEETRRKLAAEQDALDSAPRLSDEEVAAKFAEIRKGVGL